MPSLRYAPPTLLNWVAYHKPKRFSLNPCRLDFLQKTGLPKEDCKKVVMRAPSLLELSIDGTLKPRVDYLKRELSVKRDDLGKLISRSGP